FICLCFYVPFLYLFFVFLFLAFCNHRDLHSFPTRRSSDLQPARLEWDFNALNRWPVESTRPCHNRCKLAVQFMLARHVEVELYGDRKSTRLNSSHGSISYAVFCLKKKNQN